MTSEKAYRDQALKLFPWICGRCAREFAGVRLRPQCHPQCHPPAPTPLLAAILANAFLFWRIDLVTVAAKDAYTGKPRPAPGQVRVPGRMEPSAKGRHETGQDHH